jgi:hypothetical protein
MVLRYLFNKLAQFQEEWDALSSIPELVRLHVIFPTALYEEEERLASQRLIKHRQALTQVAAQYEYMVSRHEEDPDQVPLLLFEIYKGEWNVWIRMVESNEPDINQSFNLICSCLNSDQFLEFCEAVGRNSRIVEIVMIGHTTDQTCTKALVKSLLQRGGGIGKTLPRQHERECRSLVWSLC